MHVLILGKLFFIKKGMSVNEINESYISYLPLTVHWSLEKSSFPDVLVGVFGGFASIFQIYATWQSIA
jgi:hypothetical protein